MGTISRKELADQIRKLAEPVDFEELESKGIIKKCGAWYQVFDMKALPESFSGLIKGTKTDKGRLFVKLASKSGFERLAKKLK